jgi:hypothetical protein
MRQHTESGTVNLQLVDLTTPRLFLAVSATAELDNNVQLVLYGTP